MEKKESDDIKCPDQLLVQKAGLLGHGNSLLSALADPGLVVA